MFTNTASGLHIPADRMVKVELEAAEALTYLAHSSATDGKSVSRPVQNESPAKEDSRSHGSASVQLSPFAEDPVNLVKQHGDRICDMMTRPIYIEKVPEPEPNPVDTTTTYAPSVGCKSRQNLNEADKEARRVHRVLANRESARQTIRRRQVLYEELTRKAADLAWENENLKKQKELAKNEYDSLKSTNENLKTQMTNVVKVEVEERQEALKLSHAETPTSPSTSYPHYVYNPRSLLPFLWPSIVQPSNVFQLQCVPQNGIVIPSQVPEYENPTMINNVPGNPFCLLQCPWIFPLSHHANVIHPQPLHNKQKEILLDSQSSAGSTSKTRAHVGSHCVFPPIRMKTEDYNLAESVPASNLHENPFVISLDGGEGQHVEPQSQGAVLKPILRSCVRPATSVEHENIPRPTEATCVVANCSREVNKEPVVGPSKKLMNVAAAEARKRRKELTKLKNLHCRHRVSY